MASDDDIAITTDAIRVTTESSKILVTSDVDEYSTDVSQMAKLITVPNAITTIAPASFVQLNEASTTSLTTTIAESDDSNSNDYSSSTTSASTEPDDAGSSNNDNGMTTTITKTDASVDGTKNNVQDAGSILMGSSVSNDGPTMKNGNENANAQRVSINDVTNGPTIATDAILLHVEEATKSPAITNSTSANTIKVNDRSRVVSKDDIESIRGRALNFTNDERRQSMAGGVIYVTAPPSSPLTSAAAAIDEASGTTPDMPVLVKSKSAKAKSFNDDLSDVSLDNDGLDFHSKDHSTTSTMTTTTNAMKTTTFTPSIQDAQCQSKVRFLNNLLFLVCTRLKFNMQTGCETNKQKIQIFECFVCKA